VYSYIILIIQSENTSAIAEPLAALSSYRTDNATAKF